MKKLIYTKILPILASMVALTSCDSSNDIKQVLEKNQNISQALQDTIDEINKIIDDNKTKEFIEQQKNNLNETIRKFESYLDANKTEKTNEIINL